MAGAVQSNISKNIAKKRRLPADSLYHRVRHLWEARQAFSQSKAAGSLPTKVFARNLVSQALAPERPAFWRTWFGRPDAFYCGGMTRLIWWGSLVGDWLLDMAVWRTFKLQELKDIVDKERAIL
jgi:1-acylglycerone phosphate reductase